VLTCDPTDEHIADCTIGHHLARYRSEGLHDKWSQDMKIVPVNFNSEHKAMLGHCKMILEDDCGRIAINSDRFDKLITALRI
jgi:hypothetical protein